MWHGVRAFFEEGGKRLYVSRVYRPSDAGDELSGHARGGLPGSPSPLSVFARFPGRAGDARVTFTFNVGQSLLISIGGAPRISALQNRDVVWIRPVGTALSSPSVPEDFYLALRDPTRLGTCYPLKGARLAELPPIQLTTVRPPQMPAELRATLRLQESQQIEAAGSLQSIAKAPVLARKPEVDRMIKAVELRRAQRSGA